MIQNILTFCVKNDLTFVEGSIPSGKLVANDINRNSIYLVTPYDEAIVKANFQTNLQSDTPTSVLGILVNGKIAIDEIVPTSKSYYNLVKDWNIYEFKVPSTTLSFISRNRTGKIGINFSIEQRLVPTIKDSYGEYQGEILSQSQGQALTESGYYINKTIDFELDTGDVVIYDLNDILVLTKQERPLEDIQVKISAYSNRGSTPTTLYSVDPSLLNDNFETIEPSLTTQIVQQVNDNTGDIVLLFQNVGVNNATLVDFENRISVNEQDIDIAEANITNLQGRMATAESDIEDIEDGTTIVEKALKDSLGNVIKSTYANKLDLGYSSSNNRIAITLKSYDGTSLDADLINLPKATTLNDGLMAKEDKAYIDGLPSDLALKENKSEKGIANGYASLDSGAKIPSSQLPDSILGQLEYKGTFNPSSGYPASPEKGWFYIAIANATISGEDYKVGDWAVYNGVSWDKVDNTDAVASVNGKLGAVILYGNEIQVGNGDTWTVEQRIVNIYAELNNRYTKAQTYSNAEIEQRITDLLGLANLQDTAIEFTPSDYELDYNGTVVSTFPATLISDYNWVFVRVLVGSQEEYTIFKPSVSTTGVGIDLPLIQKDVFAQIERVNDDFNFALYKKADNTLSSTTASMRMWGIKLDGINATEVEYSSSVSVKQKLDDLDLKKADKTTLTNLVANGDLTLDSNSDNIPDGFQYLTATDISLVNGIVKFTATAQNGCITRLPPNTFNIVNGNTYYFYTKVKTTTSVCKMLLAGVGEDTDIICDGNWQFTSKIFTASTDYSGTGVRVNDGSTSDWKPVEVDYMGAINLTAIFGAGNEPDKAQMDAIMKVKGFFQTTTLNLIDVFDLSQELIQITANEVDYDNSTSGLVADKVQGAIDELGNYNYTTIIPNSYSRTSYYTQYTTGNQIATSSYFVQKIITNPKFSKILTYAVAGDTLPAVIAFYNDETIYDSSTYMSAYSVQFSIPNNTPKTYVSSVPFGCKAIVITSRNDLGGIDAPYTKCSDDYIAEKVDTFEEDVETGLMSSRSNIFGKNKQYSHIFIERIGDDSNPTIPCQSTYDLSISKRLGFNIVEANIQKTATVGKYVVMHGISGTIGGQLVYLNGDSASSVVIQDTTFEDLRNNFKYKSIYTKYQTKIISLDEWCLEVKKLGLTPLVQYVDDISLNIIKDYFGYDFILYNGTRDKHTGMIMRFSNTLTKQQMIDLCDEYKPPLMINVSSLSNFVTDNELIDAIKEVHKRGCLFGICGCYMSANDAIRAYRCGADFSASNSEVNPIEYGDIYDTNGELTFSDFTTTGTLVDNSIVLGVGDTITVPPSSEIPFLHASSVAIIYNGKLTISIAGLRNPTSLSSNGEESVEWSGFAINTAPYLTITANEETTVKSIRFLAKKM